MANLSDADRFRVWAGIMRRLSRLRSQQILDKPAWRAAVDATDNWLEANGASFNNALPAEAKASLSLAEKTFLLCAVAAMRVSKAFAIKILGEVD